MAEFKYAPSQYVPFRDVEVIKRWLERKAVQLPGARQVISLIGQRKHGRKILLGVSQEVGGVTLAELELGDLDRERDS